MTLPNWKAIPVRTKRSRKRLHNVIATEFNLDSWTELPNHIKRSKKRLFNYYAEELHLEEFKELLKKDVRSTREYYVYLKENANPSSAPTLTITVKSGESNVSGASVTIGSTTKSTGSDGKTTFTLDYDDYIVGVSKSGYVDLEENIKFRANHKSFTLNLEAEPSSSGTLTVTCVDSEQAPVEGNYVFVSDEQYSDIMAFMDAVEQDPTIVLGMGVTDNTGECILMTAGEDLQPVEPVITFEAGNHYLYALNMTSQGVYIGTVSINGDTTTTITLEQNNTGTVTVTVMYDDAEWSDTNICLLDGETQVAIGYSDAYGVAILTDDTSTEPIVPKQIPYGTYTLKGNVGVYTYEGSLTVDSAEVTTTITLTPVEGGK